MISGDFCLKDTEKEHHVLDHSVFYFWLPLSEFSFALAQRQPHFTTKPLSTSNSPYCAFILREQSEGAQCYSRDERGDNLHLSYRYSIVHSLLIFKIYKIQWPHGWCACLRIERSGFEPCPGTLCCVLRQDTLLSLEGLSPPRCINGYRRI